MDPKCKPITTEDDRDISLEFYYSSDFTDFNTTIIEINFKKKTDTRMNLKDNDVNIAFRISMICDSSYKIQPLVKLFQDTDEADYSVMFIHSECKASALIKILGCKKYEFGMYWNLIIRYYYFFGFLLILIGISFAFFGKTLIKYILLCTVGISVMPFFYNFFHDTFIDPPEEWKEWIDFAVCVTIGFWTGVIAVKMIKIVIFFMGALFGVFPGLVLYHMFFYKFVPNSQLALLTVLFFTGSAGGLITMQFSNQMILLITSSFGSYLITRVIK